MSRRRKPKEVLDFEREYLFPNGFRETRVNGRDGTGSHETKRHFSIPNDIKSDTEQHVQCYNNVLTML